MAQLVAVTGQHHWLPTQSPFPLLSPRRTPPGAAIGPVKSLHFSQLPCSLGRCEICKWYSTRTSGRVLPSWDRPCLSCLPLPSFPCLSADVKTAVEHLPCDMLRMQEQNDRRAWDPEAIVDVLCQPWDAYLWTHGYTG